MTGYRFAVQLLYLGHWQHRQSQTFACTSNPDGTDAGPADYGKNTVDLNEKMQGLMMAIRILVASFVILGFFVLYSEDTSAEVYKWVDEAGNVHYSDQPPPQEYESSYPLTAL